MHNAHKSHDGAESTAICTWHVRAHFDHPSKNGEGACQPPASTLATDMPSPGRQPHPDTLVEGLQPRSLWHRGNAQRFPAGQASRLTWYRMRISTNYPGRERRSSSCGNKRTSNKTASCASLPCHFPCTMPGTQRLPWRTWTSFGARSSHNACE